MKRINLNDDQNVRYLQARAAERDRVMVLARAYRIALRRANRRERDPVRRCERMRWIMDGRFVQFAFCHRWLLRFENPNDCTGPMPADCR